MGDNYITIRVLNKIAPQTLSFEDAKVMAKADFENVLKAKQLDEIAKKSLENFDGVNVGYVSRDSLIKLKVFLKMKHLHF